LNQYTFFSPFSEAYLKAAAPDYKLGLNLSYKTPKINLTLGLTKFSEIVLQDFQWVDSPPLTKADADALYDVATDVYESKLTADFSFGYQISKQFALQIGANNLFNTYPTPQFDGWTDQGGLADSVQMGSDGRYVFSRLSFNF
jgi:iron complex outermembrane receptor protein